MACDTANTIAYVGAFAGVVGGGVALFNANKAVLWKRAELANSHLRELMSNEELVFACRALDWNGGFLVVPTGLRPLLSGDSATIAHAPAKLERAMSSDLTLSEMMGDESLQIYRTAMDSLLSWLAILASALKRNLFVAEDVKEIGYWVRKIQDNPALADFIKDYGYSDTIQTLRFHFR